MKGNEVSEKGIHQTCDGNHKYPLKVASLYCGTIPGNDAILIRV